MAAMPVLRPLHDEAGLRRLVVSTYQAVSGSGLAGVEELDTQVRAAVEQDTAGARARRRRGDPARAEEVRAPDRVRRHPARGHRSSTTARSRPTRSRSSATRAARSSASPSCSSAAPACACPVFTGHSLSINAEFDRPLSVERALELLARRARRRGHRRADPAAGRGRRTRRTSAASGRTRASPTASGLALFVSNDNLRKGAALNAVQIAELVAARLPQPTA